MKQIISHTPLPTSVVECSKIHLEPAMQAGTGIIAYETHSGKGVAILIGLTEKFRAPRYGFVYITKLLKGRSGELKFPGTSPQESLSRVLAANRKLMLFENQQDFFSYLATSETFDGDTY